jgi:regulator of extracellular matrix RemA (YlzA/DUF370 family)
LNESKPIHRVTPEAIRSRRASDADSVGVARSEAESAEPSEVHEVARARRGNPIVKPGSTPDFTTRTHTTRLLNVGYGNLIAAPRIVAIVAPNASPMRRLRHDAAERGKLVDATEGRRTRSIVILDSDHVVLSAINPETLAARLAEDGTESHA